MEGISSFTKPVSELEYHWEYSPEKLASHIHLRYLSLALKVGGAPDFKVLKPLKKHKQWIVYFVYAPEGILYNYHHFTLQKLKEYNCPLLVIFSSKRGSPIPPALIDYSDALIWKDLKGYDFSAYSIALHSISKESPGASVFVMNDSVLGPFNNLINFIDNAPWDLTGLTAFDSSTDNIASPFKKEPAWPRHIQSYAFILRDLTEEKMAAMRQVFPLRFSFNKLEPVVVCQEVWMTRIANRVMSTGAYWCGHLKKSDDPTLTKAAELYDAGFPFIKRSLIGKHSHYKTEKVIEILQSEGHPINLC